jgi:hypothetical protein
LVLEIDARRLTITPEAAVQGEVGSKSSDEVNGKRAGYRNAASGKYGALRVGQPVPLGRVALGGGARDVTASLEKKELRLDRQTVREGHDDVPPDVKIDAGVDVGCQVHAAAPKGNGAVTQKSEGRPPADPNPKVWELLRVSRRHGGHRDEDAHGHDQGEQGRSTSQSVREDGVQQDSFSVRTQDANGEPVLRSGAAVDAKKGEQNVVQCQS